MAEYYSTPALINAIQFLPDGSNFQEVINIIKLNKGEAEMHYLNADGSPAARNTITQYKGLAILSAPGGVGLPAYPGDYIVMGEEFYPIPKELFEPHHVKSVGEISNGVHSFSQLYASIAEVNEHYVPTVIDIEARPVIRLSEDTSYDLQEFIKAQSVIVTDGDGMNYYVINGNVFVF